MSWNACLFEILEELSKLLEEYVFRQEITRLIRLKVPDLN